MAVMGGQNHNSFPGEATIACDAIVATPKQKFIRADCVSGHAKKQSVMGTLGRRKTWKTIN